MTRALFALLLSLVLALTSHSAAVVRGGPAAVDHMVICTGFGAKVIYTDADGQPTSAPHLCPDCLVNLEAGLLPTWVPVALASVAMRPQAVSTRDIAHRINPSVMPPARGPPGLI